MVEGSRNPSRYDISFDLEVLGIVFTFMFVVEFQLKWKSRSRPRGGVLASGTPCNMFCRGSGTSEG